ncbi:ankyrin repeat-containing domain protein [Baffinella frigidus]|nr:ankyrin repeat-containing domain protein [Cryptophyta sp. CCMP2293]
MDTGSPALWKAAYTGDIERCKRLLATHRNTGGYVDERGGSNGTSPLCTAIHCSGREDGKFFHNHLEIARLLIDAGADVTAVSAKGDTTPLHQSIQFGGGAEFLNLILKNRDSIDIDKKSNGKTPLFMAVSNRCNNMKAYQNQVESLIKRGADVKTVDNHGNSILHQWNMSEWLLSRLIQQGVDINRKGEHGRTPLHFILYDTEPAERNESGLYYMILLIAKGVDLDIKDGKGLTALGVASRRFRNTHPMYRLLRKNTES